MILKICFWGLYIRKSMAGCEIENWVLMKRLQSRKLRNAVRLCISYGLHYLMEFGLCTWRILNIPFSSIRFFGTICYTCRIVIRILERSHVGDYFNFKSLRGICVSVEWNVLFRLLSETKSAVKISVWYFPKVVWEIFAYCKP